MTVGLDTGLNDSERHEQDGETTVQLGGDITKESEEIQIEALKRGLRG